MWHEARKLFAASPGRKRHPDVSVVAKDLALANASLGEFLTSKFALWLDLRTTDDDRLHGSGRRIENASEGVTEEVLAEAAGQLNIYLYILIDAQLNLEDGRFVSCPRTPIRLLFVGRHDAEKRPSSWPSSKAPTGGVFRHIVVLCPTIEHNKTYKQCPWLWTDPEIFVLDPGERLHNYLRAFYQVFQGEPTLFIIDDCSASAALTKKKDMLSELAFVRQYRSL